LGNTGGTTMLDKCPTCGSPELHPDGDKLLLRCNKVHHSGVWWSQCLVCAGYYGPGLTARPIGKDGRNPDYNKDAGWWAGGR